MTISYERKQAEVYAGKTFCRTCNRHLAMVHHGYGSEAEPLGKEDIETLNNVAQTHDRLPDQHDIVVYLFSPTHAK